MVKVIQELFNKSYSVLTYLECGSPFPWPSSSFSRSETEPGPGKANDQDTDHLFQAHAFSPYIS